MGAGRIQRVTAGLRCLEAPLNVGTQPCGLAKCGKQVLLDAAIPSAERRCFSSSGGPRIFRREEKAGVILGLEQVADVPGAAGGPPTCPFFLPTIHWFLEAKAESKRGRDRHGEGATPFANLRRQFDQCCFFAFHGSIRRSQRVKPLIVEAGKFDGLPPALATAPSGDGRP